MLHHLGAEHIKGNVLVVAAGNQNYLLMEGAQTGDGAGGLEAMESLVAHPVPRPHSSMRLYPRKFGGEVPRFHLVGHQPVRAPMAAM